MLLRSLDFIALQTLAGAAMGALRLAFDFLKETTPMNIEKLIRIAISAVLIAAATGQLPRLVWAVRAAQYELLKESQASKWQRAMLLKEK